jgi:hypothetical protein
MPKKTNDGKISSTRMNCSARVWRRKKSNIEVTPWTVALQAARTADRLRRDSQRPDATKANRGSPLGCFVRRF